MTKYVLAEFTKFKYSKVKYSILVLLVPVILVFIMYAVNNKKYPIVEWDSYLTTIETFLNLLVCMLVFGIITSYVFGVEYETKTINVLFTYPIHRIKLLFSKLTLIFIIIMFSLISVFLISIFLGMLIKHDPLTLNIISDNFMVYIKMICMHFILVTIIPPIVFHTKSVLPAVVFIVGASFFNIILVNTKLSSFYPWSIPVLFTPHAIGGRSYTNYSCSFIVLFLLLIIGVFYSAIKFRYTE